MQEPDVDTQPRSLGPFGPDGQAVTRSRPLTGRAARPWLRRADVEVGEWPCGSPIAWVSAADREALVSGFRARRGRDCQPHGDYLLLELWDGRRGVVLIDH